MRRQHEVEGIRDAIPGANIHELALELCRTIDDAASRVGMAIDDSHTPVIKAINDLEARLETIEDALRDIKRAIVNAGPA